MHVLEKRDALDKKIKESEKEKYAFENEITPLWFTFLKIFLV